MNTQVEMQKIDPAENCAVIVRNTDENYYLSGELRHLISL